MKSAVTADTAQERALFDTVPLLAALDSTARDGLWAASRSRCYDRGDVIVPQGARTDSVLVLLSGTGTSVVSTWHGRTVTIATWPAPCVLDKVAMFAGKAHPASIIADGPVRLRVLTLISLLNCLELSRDARRHVLHMVAVAAQSSRVSFVDAVAKSSLARVAGWLLGAADDEGVLTIGRPQERLAATLGMTRVTLNRNLRRLAADGLIAREEESIRVIESQGLRALADR